MKASGVGFGFTLALACTVLAAAGTAHAGDRQKILITSTADRTEQPSYLIVPDGFDPKGPPVPLLVSLHTWSHNVEQRHKGFEQGAEKLGWLFLLPNFRGRNEQPEACGSLLAQQDILDAVDWVLAHYPVDQRKIYLCGLSGGGHMAMLMAGRYPQRWTAVSAWVGISDLRTWHQRHAQDSYGKMLRACCGGAPGDSPAVDEQYRLRSPITWIAASKDLPLDLAAGVHDGHKGSVPVRQTIDAFNAVAQAQGLPGVSEEEIQQISRPDGRLDKPLPSDQPEKSDVGRAIYLRRTAGKARVTIFEGGHQRLDSAALQWLSQQSK